MQVMRASGWAVIETRERWLATSKAAGVRDIDSLESQLVSVR